MSNLLYNSTLRERKEVVDELAQAFSETAAERDQCGGTAKSERDRLRESGLLTLAIPSLYGGA